MQTIVVRCVAFFVFLTITSFAENWPGWRGTLGTGKAEGKNFPTTWSRDKNVRWRIDLPERGNSSPVVWGDRVFVTQAIEAKGGRQLLCFHREDGRLLWQGPGGLSASSSWWDPRARTNVASMAVVVRLSP